MSEQLRESLSAAMDNEADAFELRRVLDEASADPELREQWHRMHILRDVLRGEAEHYDGDLRANICAQMEELDFAVDDEDDPLAVVEESQPKPSSGWLGKLAGGAVAAAVAALVVINGDVLLESDADGQAQIAQAQKDLDTATRPVPVMYREATADDRMRLDAHRMIHYQQNALNRSGAVSFVRMATFGLTPATRVRVRGNDSQSQRTAQAGSSSAASADNNVVATLR